eukprot:1161355-Pelagomonas_calceolata.AAC.2
MSRSHDMLTRLCNKERADICQACSPSRCCNFVTCLLVSDGHHLTGQDMIKHDHAELFHIHVTAYHMSNSIRWASRGWAEKVGQCVPIDRWLRWARHGRGS